VKKQLLMISMLAIAISVAGCTLPPATSAPTAPVVQVTYAQACAAYGAAFAGVLQLRKANKLNQVQNRPGDAAGRPDHPDLHRPAAG
jgi:hypothetical protein